VKHNTNNFPKSLAELFDQLLEKRVITPSRQATCKSSLRNYAKLLGTDLDHCTPNLFIKSDTERNLLIEEGLVRVKKNRKNQGSNLSDSAVRNVKNDVSFVLRNAVKLALIETKDIKLASLREARKASSQYKQGRPKRGEMIVNEKYILDPIPSNVQRDLDEYHTWCTAEFTTKRPRSLKRRPISHYNQTKHLLRLAGYLVKFEGVPAGGLALSDLTIPQFLENYVNWYIKSRGKCTVSVTSICSASQTLAKYFQITSETNESKRVYVDRLIGLSEIKSTLPVAEAVVDKDKRKLPLKEIDAIGLKCDPFNFDAEELSDTKRQKLDYLKAEGVTSSKVGNLKQLALQAAVSLMIRLLVRRPFRQRNLREMQWNPVNSELGRNLYKVAGKWRLRFKGEQLKVSQRKGKVNFVEYSFPEKLNKELDRYINIWRPELIDPKTNKHYSPEVDKELPKMTNQEYFFLNSEGSPFSAMSVTNHISNVTYQYADVAVNPHMLRTIWTTEYLKEKGMKGAAIAAYMLNDKIETVLRDYADLLTPDCEDDATEWLAKVLDD
jgi:integrase